MNSAESDISNTAEGDVTTVLAEDLDIKGTMKFRKSLMLKGGFEGEIISEGLLVIGPTAKVKATILTHQLVSHGDIHGDVTTEARIILKKTAKHTGNLSTPDLVIEDGSIFNGTCTMGNKATARVVEQDTAQDSAETDRNDGKHGESALKDDQEETKHAEWDEPDTSGEFTPPSGEKKSDEDGNSVSETDALEDLSANPDEDSLPPTPGHIESHIESNSSVTFLKSFGMSGSRDKRKR